jgi:hypothetical protein
VLLQRQAAYVLLLLLLLHLQHQADLRMAGHQEVNI